MSITRPFIIAEAQAALETWDDPARPAVVWRTLLSGDRAPTAGLTLGVAEMVASPETTAGLHRHSQAEAYHVLSGEGIVSIDGVERALAPGVTVFIPGQAWHGAWATGPTPLRLLYVFAADSFADIHYEFANEA